MRRSRAPSNWPGPFFAARSWAGCTTNMFGFDLRQAKALRIFDTFGKTTFATLSANSRHPMSYSQAKAAKACQEVRRSCGHANGGILTFAIQTPDGYPTCSPCLNLASCSAGELRIKELPRRIRKLNFVWFGRMLDS